MIASDGANHRGDRHDQDEAPDDTPQATFLSHLVELRDRLLKSVVALTIVALCLFPFAQALYTTLAGPLIAKLPEGSSMIAVEVASPFLVPFKLSLLLAVILTVPYLLYQAWAFVAPGLYQHERRLALPILVTSVLLFYLGMAFAYFVVFPLVFGFFTSVVPEGVEVMTDISHYLSFVTTLFIAFGVAFEVPIVTFVVVAMGLATPAQLQQARPYVVVAAFVIGMLLTPPDVISQVLLAVPMWLLYELGILFSRRLIKGRDGEDGEDGASEPTT